LRQDFAADGQDAVKSLEKFRKESLQEIDVELAVRLREAKATMAEDDPEPEKVERAKETLQEQARRHAEVNEAVDQAIAQTKTTLEARLDLRQRQRKAQREQRRRLKAVEVSMLKEAEKLTESPKTNKAAVKSIQELQRQANEARLAAAEAWDPDAATQALYPDALKAVEELVNELREQAFQEGEYTSCEDVGQAAGVLREAVLRALDDLEKRRALEVEDCQHPLLGDARLDEPAPPGETKRERAMREQFKQQDEFHFNNKLDKDLAHAGWQYDDQRNKIASKLALRRKQVFEAKFGPSAKKIASLILRVKQQVQDIVDELSRQRRERAESVEAEVEELRARKRRGFQQLAAMNEGSMVLLVSKQRLQAAWKSGQYNWPQLKKALHDVKQAHERLKDLEVDSENKQKLSVLLYTMRSLETRLEKEVSSNKDPFREKQKDSGDPPEGDRVRDMRNKWAATEAEFEPKLAQECAQLRQRLVAEAMKEYDSAAKANLQPLKKKLATLMRKGGQLVETYTQERHAGHAVARRIPELIEVSATLCRERARYDIRKKSQKKLVPGLEKTHKVLAQLRLDVDSYLAPSTSTTEPEEGTTAPPGGPIIVAHVSDLEAALKQGKKCGATIDEQLGEAAPKAPPAPSKAPPAPPSPAVAVPEAKGRTQRLQDQLAQFDKMEVALGATMDPRKRGSRPATATRSRPSAPVNLPPRR